MRAGPMLSVLIDMIGITSFAVNAIMAGRTETLPTMGIFVVAAATALETGTLRNIPPGPSAQPFFWLSNPYCGVVICVRAVGHCHAPPVRALPDRRDVPPKEVAEVIAFAPLAARGAVKAPAILVTTAGEGWLPILQIWLLAAFFGAMTVAFGGVLRDVLIGHLPGALKPGGGTIGGVFVGSAVAAGLRDALVCRTPAARPALPSDRSLP